VLALGATAVVRASGPNQSDFGLVGDRRHDPSVFLGFARADHLPIVREHGLWLDVTQFQA
jgi:hypothetical protein